MRIFLCSLFLLLTTSPHLWAAAEAKRLVALVDYIGGDYKNAVRDGQVINEDEYHEMIEFCSRSLELLFQLKARESKDPAGVGSDLRRLAAEVKNKGDVTAVTELAQGVKKRLIAAYQITTFPYVLPELAAGQSVYQENCAQCHGEAGRGDGPSVATMQPKEPKPANFTDGELISGLSPFKAFNTTTFGIEGTAMPDFSALDESERWQAAFYLFSLRFSRETAAQGKKLFEAGKFPEDLTRVASLATLSDREIEEKLKPYFVSAEERLKIVAYFRRGLLEERHLDPLLAARGLLQEALILYEQGQRERAYQKAADAYLEGFELAEPTLFARDPAFGHTLEVQFGRFRNAIRYGEDTEKVQTLYQEIATELDKAADLMQSNPISGIYLFSNAALIILREGLEAALIIAAILALLGSMGATTATRYIHLGWTLALVAGAATWGLAQTVLTVSGSQREIMEGLTTLIAAGVLFYVSYWLISKMETKKWQGFIRQKVQEALTGKRILALIGISFFAVYREAVETILFYQALWLQSASDTASVVWGFLVGLSSLFLIILGIFSLGVKIPLKQFFGITSTLLYLLAFVFIGRGVEALQAGGWISVTPLPFLPRIDLLGIYSTLETVLAQGIVLLAPLAALVWIWRAHWLRVKGSAV
jgi:high-affinity iron transporter